MNPALAITEIDAITGEVTIRPMTPEEIAARPKMPEQSEG